MCILKNRVSWTSGAGSLYCTSHSILALRLSKYLLFPLQHLSSCCSQYLLSGSFLCTLFPLRLTFPSGSLPFSGVYICSFFLSLCRFQCSFSSLGICFMLIKLMYSEFLPSRDHPSQCLANKRPLFSEVSGKESEILIIFFGLINIYKMKMHQNFKFPEHVS